MVVGRDVLCMPIGQYVQFFYIFCFFFPLIVGLFLLIVHQFFLFHVFSLLDHFVILKDTLLLELLFIFFKSTSVVIQLHQFLAPFSLLF